MRFFSTTLPVSLLILFLFLFHSLPADAQIFKKKGNDKEKKGEEEGRPAFRVTGGLTVHVHCGDGRKSIEAALSGSCLVHAWTEVGDDVAAVRRLARSAGVDGRVLVECLEEKTLPYHENTVTVVILDQSQKSLIPLKEAHRVLRPGGRIEADKKHCSSESVMTRAGFVRVRQEEERWVGEKAWPQGMDDWTHYRHGPDRNPVSADSALGIPNSVRWIMGRSRGGNLMISALGRNFYMKKDRVLVRDSFTGIPLWEKSGVTKETYPVACGDRFYMITGGKIVVLDAADGKQVRSFPNGGGATEFAVLKDVILATDGKGAVWTVDLKEGTVKWTVKMSSPHNLITGGGSVFFLSGGKDASVVALDLEDGTEKWRKSGAEYKWAGKATHSSHALGMLAYEISTFNDDDSGNEVHILDARTGAILGERSYAPGMAHNKQAKTFIVDGNVMVHEGRSLRPAVSGARGVKTVRVGSGHCYTGVATKRFFIHGEMDFTDLKSGKVSSNRITKGACGRSSTPGYVPASGLLFSYPKACVCFPMLEGYGAFGEVGIATGPPRKVSTGSSRSVPSGAGKSAPRKSSLLGSKKGEDSNDGGEWPMYRGDATRGAAARMSLDGSLKELWRVDIPAFEEAGTGGGEGNPISGGKGDARLLESEWENNPYVRAKVTPAVVAGGKVIVAEPDRHRVLCFDAETGEPCWVFTANGRIDSSPSICDGVCLFGTRSGFLYGVDLEGGHLLWKMMAGPVDRRIVAYGQIESCWPVAGSVLLYKGTAYAVAGRHPDADGGVRMIAFRPKNGQVVWTGIAEDTGIRHAYNRQGLDYDYFDHPVLDGADIAMSRWKFNPSNGQVKLERESGYFLAGGAWVPRSFWSYGYPNSRSREMRDLLAFQGNEVYGIYEGKLFRRDFQSVKDFNHRWFSEYDENKKADRMERIAKSTRWTQSGPKSVRAMALSNEHLLVVSGGSLTAYDRADGKQSFEKRVDSAAWDGLSLAGGKIYLVTENGRLICLGP